MAKKGVFGMKETPLDSVRGTSPSAPKPQKRDPEIRIVKMNGGFTVHCSPKTTDEYKDESYVKESLDDALKIARDHLEGKKDGD
jgi:hypothetical protein